MWPIIIGFYFGVGITFVQTFYYELQRTANDRNEVLNFYDYGIVLLSLFLWLPFYIFTLVVSYYRV